MKCLANLKFWIEIIRFVSFHSIQLCLKIMGQLGHHRSPFPPPRLPQLWPEVKSLTKYLYSDLVASHLYFHWIWGPLHHVSRFSIFGDHLQYHILSLLDLYVWLVLHIRSLLKLVLHHVGQAFDSVVGDASSADAIGLQVSWSAFCIVLPGSTRVKGKVQANMTLICKYRTHLIHVCIYI